MNKEITAQVVMLPTNSNNSHIGILKRNIDIINPLIYNSVGIFNTFAWSSQHLHFTTDEPIQKGHWYLHENISKPVKESGLLKWGDDLLKRFKVIASTDPALDLPAIPTAWIRDEYVPSQGSIKEIRVETEPYLIRNGDNTLYYDIKLTPDNEVVIVGEPKVFTKEEFEYQLKHVVPIDQRGTWAKENWPKVVHPTKSVDQELEDAANNWIDSHYNKGVEYSKSKRNAANPKSGFKAGAEWQKERSFSLMRWANLNDYTLSSEGWIQDTDSKPISDQELYSKWLQYTKQ